MNSTANSRKLRSSNPAQAKVAVQPAPTHKIREEFKLKLCDRIHAKKVLWKGNQIGRVKDAAKAWEQVARQFAQTVPEVKATFNSIKESLKLRISRAIENGANSWEKVEDMVNNACKKRILPPRLWAELPWLAQEITSECLRKKLDKSTNPAEKSRATQKIDLAAAVDAAVADILETGRAEHGATPAKRRRTTRGGKTAHRKEEAEKQIPSTSSGQRTGVQSSVIPNSTASYEVLKQEDESDDDDMAEHDEWNQEGPPVHHTDPSASTTGTTPGTAQISGNPCPSYAASSQQHNSSQCQSQEGSMDFSQSQPEGARSNTGDELTSYIISNLETMYFHNLGVVDSKIAEYVVMRSREVAHCLQFENAASYNQQDPNPHSTD